MNFISRLKLKDMVKRDSNLKCVINHDARARYVIRFYSKEQYDKAMLLKLQQQIPAFISLSEVMEFMTSISVHKAKLISQDPYAEMIGLDENPSTVTGIDVASH